MHIIHVGVAGPSKISWLLYTYSSVRVHFWSRNNIGTFPVAQHLKFCYHFEHIQKETVPLCDSLINYSDVAAQKVVIIRLDMKTKYCFQEIICYEFGCPSKTQTLLSKFRS